MKQATNEVDTRS